MLKRSISMQMLLTKTTSVPTAPAEGRLYFGPFKPGDMIDAVEISCYGNGVGGAADVAMAMFPAVPATADDTAANFEANLDQLVGGDYTGGQGKAIKINGVAPGGGGQANTPQYKFRIRRKATPQAAVLGLHIGHTGPNNMWFSVTVHARPATGDAW